MIQPHPFITDVEQYATRKSDVEECFRLGLSLPKRLFSERFENFRFEELFYAMSAGFWPTIQALCQRSGDASVLIAVLDPDPLSYYKKNFGYFNWAELPVSSASDDYWEMLNYHPDDSLADSILVNSERIVWVPPSKCWAIIGLRSYEVCVLGCLPSFSCDMWNDIEWALDTPIPYAFRGRIVPDDFAEEFRHSYGARA